MTIEQTKLPTISAKKQFYKKKIKELHVFGMSTMIQQKTDKRNCERKQKTKSDRCRGIRLKKTNERLV